MGVDSSEGVNVPIVMTEAVANLAYSRKSMTEIMFECYNVPSLSYGKLNASQAEHMVRDHCYLSQNYDQEIAGYLDWEGLEDRDRVIQYPFVEEVIIQKSEEELAKIAERKQESGRRLQAQAQKMRLEKLVQKEQELEYYRDLQSRLVDQTKKEIKRLLDDEEMKDEAALERTIKELDKSIRKQRIKDVGGPEIEEEVEEPDYSLLDTPDDQLDEAGIKAKRHQRLMKSNNEARARAKAEKEREKARIAEEQRADEERRENNLEGWLQDRRSARAEIIQKMKDRDRLKADLGNRKSLANAPTKKRRRGNDDDNFGANDDDWGVYRQIATGDGSDDEEEEDFGAGLKTLEADLLKYDPEFTDQHTLDAQTDWTKSLVHAFLRGPRPFDPKSQGEAHQLHLNVERIRVPEVIFQPAIAGLDQAGLIEIAADILTTRLNNNPNQGDFLKDIFLTGGHSQFQNFDERLREGLRGYLPAGAPVAVRRAKDPILDSWKGAARWAGSEKWKSSQITRADYLEKGAEWFKTSLAPYSHLARVMSLPICEGQWRYVTSIEGISKEVEHDLGNAYS
ncbi:putative Actin-related protein 5 [Glarea lozoyensis 74030]|uniref:Putative Actin-related protein 5 n=1 Tax=Glarea lozoyensis (strain ATCC 74030 / MF5533) TaxID=1104152 RepID=H0EVP6_GLAL7|nr:putative Actin-related protein 5 [Glarea lozoyensis 74030]